MKSRKEVVSYINSGQPFKETRKTFLGGGIEPHHFGVIELKVIMDFIYGGAPKDKDEEINRNFCNVIDDDSLCILSKFHKVRGC